MPVTLVWDGADLGVFGWIADRLGSLRPRWAASRAVKVRTGAPEVFRTEFTAPVTDRNSLKKAVELALPQLMPVSVDGLIVFARFASGAVELAAVRRGDIDDSKRGRGRLRKVRLGADWVAPTPAERNARQRWMVVAVMAIAVSIVCLIMVQTRAIQHYEEQALAILDDGERVRAQALAAAGQRNEADLWASLSASKPNARTASAIIAVIANLARLTPADASWIKLDWSVDQITLEGSGKDPVALLGALSRVEGMSARFSKPVTPLGDGRQQFEVLLSSKETKERQ